MKQIFRVFYDPLSALALGAFVLATIGCPGPGASTASTSTGTTSAHCASLSNDQAKCQADKKCFYISAKKSCVDASSVKCADLAQADCGTNAACFWDTSVTPNVCTDKGTTTTKYYSYNFDVLDSATTHGFNNAEITGVASSKDRAYVYVMKGAPGAQAAIQSSNNNGATWVAVDHLDDRGKPTDNGDVCDMTQNGIFDVYAPLTDGLIVQHEAGCIGIIRGDEVPANSVWTWAVANLTGNGEPARSFFEAKKAADNSLYIYATAANRPAAGVAFQSLAGLSDPWNMHVTNAAGGPLTRVYTALGQVPDGSLIMGNRSGLFRVAANGVGVDAAQMINAENAPAVSNADLSLDGGTTANNQRINAITFVDDKYLLIGLSAGGDANKGGVVFTDIGAAPVWTPFGAGLTMTVRKIVASGDNKGAMIVSDNGLVYFRDGKFVEVVPGEKLINQALVNANPASFKDKASAKTGFGGALPTNDLFGAAEDATGKWYFGSPSGVIRLEIKEKDI